MTRKQEISSRVGTWTINGDGTVTDRWHRLTWMQAPQGMYWDGLTFRGEPESVNFNEAAKRFGLGSQVVKGFEQRGSIWSAADISRPECSMLPSRGRQIVRFAGRSDWRLPNVRELHSLLLLDMSTDDHDKMEWDGRHDLSRLLFPFGRDGYLNTWSASYKFKHFFSFKNRYYVAWAMRFEYGVLYDFGADQPNVFVHLVSDG